MSEGIFNIRIKEHYKLYIPFKDKILFESELKKQGIPYNLDLTEQPFIESGVRYFLLDSDRAAIDNVLIKNQIIASVESQMYADYRDTKKSSKIYWIVLLVILGVALIAIVIEKTLF